MGQCSHQLCGSHLLRELTFVVEATARLMKSLLREVCHKINKSASKTLNEADRRAVHKRYRTILTQGAKELPDISPPPKGKRGRKSDAHNLHERLVKHENLRFTDDPNVSFTNNAGEQKIRMAKVKVSGCFRSTQKHGAEAQATSPPWPHSATTHSSPPRSPSTEKPQTSSTSTTANQNPTRGE